MSELLRFQHRDDQVAEHAHADEQADRRSRAPRVTSLHQPVARGHVADADDEKQDRHPDEHKIEHVRLLFSAVMRLR